MAGKVTPISGVFPTQRPDKVTTYDLLANQSLGGAYPRVNPDTLVGRKGLAIYSQMANDEQVKAVLNFKRDAITARGFAFKFRDDTSLSDDEQAVRKRVFEECIKRMRGSFSDALNMIMTGRAYGFSITEKVYGELEIDGKDWTGINKLLGRDPCTFQFYTDEYGTLDKIEQLVSGRPPLKVDPRRVIHYVHAPEWDHVYGRSDLREAYKFWYIKDVTAKLWPMWLEKMAGGFVVAQRDVDGPSFGSEEYHALQEAVRNVKSLGGMISPPGVTITIEMPTDTDAFKTAVEFADLAIAKALLVPNLLGISHTGQTGAYSQSQTQLEAFFWTLNADASRVEACLNEQLFRDLGDQNWGDGEYPEFCFKPASWEHVKWVLETWQKILSTGAAVATEEDETFIRRLLEFPPRDEKSTPIISPMDEQANAGASADRSAAEKTRQDENGFRDREVTVKERAQQLAEDEAKKAKGYQATADLIVSKLGAIEEKVAVPPVVNVPPVEIPPPPPPFDPAPLMEKFTAAMAASNAALLEKIEAVSAEVKAAAPRSETKTFAFGRAKQRVAFSVINARMEVAAERATPALADLVARSAKRALGDDAAIGDLIDTDPQDVATFQLNGADIGKLKTGFLGPLRVAYETGALMARNEIDRAKGETFTRKIAFADLKDVAAGYFEANGFRMAGNVADKVKSIIQGELLNAVKFGKSIVETRTNIWDRLVAGGVTSRGAVRAVETDTAVNSALDALWVDTETGAAHYLDTLIRTNTFEAMNEARFAEFTDPALGGFVLALEYAAVLDDVTTEICSQLNGATFAADSELWDTYRPPNHYNCRSVLVPITAIDGWDGRESEEPSVEPQAGFA